MTATDLQGPARAILSALVNAQDAGRPAPSLGDLAALAGLPANSRARYYLLCLSDQRLIDGATTRRPTAAGRLALGCDA